MLKLLYAEPKHLCPYKRNSRVHSEEQVEQIAASIKEFGFLNPILIDSKTMEIIAGHGRLDAAFKLRLQSVPIIEVSHLTDAQKRAYTIADNSLALNATWDAELLKAELSDLALDDFDLSLLGMTNFTIKVEEDSSEEGEEEDEEDSKDDKPTKGKAGSKDFANKCSKCPKCGFEFNP
jgi:ParB-like chromosome segregation protein Spo0J